MNTTALASVRKAVLTLRIPDGVSFTPSYDRRVNLDHKC
jgi:hypothetical protein